MNFTYQVECVDLKPLNCLQIRAQLEFWQVDDLIAAICGGVADDHQRVDVALRQQSQCHVSVS